MSNSKLDQPSESPPPRSEAGAIYFEAARTILQTPSLRTTTFDAYLSNRSEHPSLDESLLDENSGSASGAPEAFDEAACGSEDERHFKSRAQVHDFNNSMQGIVSVLNLLQHKLRKSGCPDVDGLIEVALNSVDRVSMQVRKMVGVHVSNAIATPPLDINSVIGSLDTLLATLLGQSIELRLLLSSDSLQICCDTCRLENAVINLVLNARDAMPRGGKLLIQTGVVLAPEGLPELDSPRYASIRIMDTGCGMSAQVLARAFDPHFTTRQARRGRGMGLWSVKEFIDGMGGHIVLRSIENEGTSTELLFPL
ncbi:MAG: sensor hybrid histidine kinase [Tardiphaga sp.]|nr:sensor hybrid histidine kinase [Tardiphaga sp.]